MKKVFSKELWKKFCVAMMVIITFLMVSPQKVQAANPVGKIAEPIADMILGISDGIVNIATKYIIYAKKDYCPKCNHYWTSWIYADGELEKTDYDDKVKERNLSRMSEEILKEEKRILYLHMKRMEKRQFLGGQQLF